MSETARRREKQMAHNEAHGITPASVKKAITASLGDSGASSSAPARAAKGLRPEATAMASAEDLRKQIKETEKLMKQAAADLEFEDAARLRDQLRALEAAELERR